MPLAAAIPYILQGASFLGGLFGHKQKTIDPEYLRTHFGAEAITKQAQELAQRIMASAYGQQLMASAAESGQQLQTDVAQRAAESGLSPETGGQSAASDFATSAAAGAQSAFERGAKGSVFQAALPIAQDLVSQQQAAYIQGINQQNATPSLGQRIGSVAGAAASLYPTQQAPVTATAPTAGQAPVTSAIPVPRLNVAPVQPTLERMAAGPNVAPDQFGMSSTPRRFSSEMLGMGAVQRRPRLTTSRLRPVYFGA